MSVEHSTWTVRREYRRPVAVVFRAWSEAVTKQRWFDLSGSGSYASDFRPGGTEVFRSAAGVSPPYAYDGTYCDIVLDDRIVIASTVSAADRRVSASLTTAEFATTGTQTRLELTEQAAFFDGLDTAEVRRRGTLRQLDALARLLEDLLDPRPRAGTTANPTASSSDTFDNRTGEGDGEVRHHRLRR